MTKDDLARARETLGEAWGFGRPLHRSELGRALRMAGRDPGRTMGDYEDGRSPIPGPLSVAIEMMLAGAPPPVGIHNLKIQRAPRPTTGA